MPSRKSMPPLNTSLTQQRLQRAQRQPPPPPPHAEAAAAAEGGQDEDSPHYEVHVRLASVQHALRQQRLKQAHTEQRTQLQASLGRTPSSGGVPLGARSKRSTGARAPTFTMASSKPATRPAPQGALHRLGQERPAGPKLPFLTALIVPPKASVKEGEVPRMQLFHSQRSPGYVQFSS